jgi:predicted RNA-binding Zn-ribbon protein involved in translation (DUF1610 family)
MAREQAQHYFKCPSCRWFGPLTTDELATLRVNELGSSPCPRCGQAGYLDPAMRPRTMSRATWLTIGAVVAIIALVAALS